jgi:hypothetical protein
MRRDDDTDDFYFSQKGIDCIVGSRDVDLVVWAMKQKSVVNIIV